MKPIIRAEGISKLYNIGTLNSASYSTLREALVQSFRAPMAKLKGRRDKAKTSFWALKDVGFDIFPGEVVGVIGHNGAGKSTLLKVLSRITEPTAGRVELYGRIASLLEVGTGFHPELTGRENIYLNGAILGMRRQEIQSKFDQIVAFAEVEKFIDTPVKRYSSGMYMRLAFAVAAHMEPEILLIDEVLAVGDAAFQKKCLGKMEDVAREGRTVVFVSHNMTAMRSLCSRGLLLKEGQIRRSGSIDECIDDYLSLTEENDSCVVDTRSLPRKGINFDDDYWFRIDRVRLETSTGRANLNTGEPLAVTLHFHTTVPITNLVLGFAVNSADNTMLFECRSTDSVGVIKELRPGHYTVQASALNNLLNPGLYTLSVGARCESKGLDYLPGVITFRIDSTETFNSVWLEVPSGVFRVRSNWELPSAETVAAGKDGDSSYSGFLDNRP
jgi:lipopolysaccharide transport system ATP-binding protein